MEEQQFTSGHDFHARLLNYDEQLKKKEKHRQM